MAAIDENLYSRQLYAIGHDAMVKMSAAHVLISGLSGLGVEIAKNAILSGFKEITLHDTENATTLDLSSQYYLTEESIGKNRAEACFNKLSELNSYVKVNVFTGELDEQFLKQFSVIVLTNTNSKQEQIRINKIARSNDAKFIMAKTHGLMGSIFCDFGDMFAVNDTDGEKYSSLIIKGIHPTIETEDLHHLTTGDFVNITGICGIDSKEPLEVKVTNSTNFTVVSDVNMETVEFTSGEATRIKIGKTIKFKSLEESMTKPEFNHVNYFDFERQDNLHACMLALHLFCPVGHEYDRKNITYDKFVKVVKKFIDNEKLNEKTVKMFMHGIGHQLSPVNAIIGGCVAQEIIKGSSGKFHPICQWLYYDAFECLDDAYDYDTVNTDTTDSRYSSQIEIFGQDFQDKLMNQKWMVVGAGAIGCELLKNFAMMGLGNIIVTDMDTIEKSNLNRQFLFRPKDIGAAKSETAAKAIKEMNSDINIEYHLNRVGKESEGVYNNEFFGQIDGIANALDNVQARLYMDSQCVSYKKPLLESGTLGTKGNVQAIVPHLTESYGSSQDPPEKSIPICTIKNFPNAIEHTIQWAKELFQNKFVETPTQVDSYLKFPNEVRYGPITNLIFAAEQIDDMLSNCPKVFNDCIKWAFNLYLSLYRDQIIQLLHQFPQDAKTKEGAPFWSGTKKCPKALEDISDATIEFIFNAANLRANLYGLTGSNSKKYVEQYVKQLDIPVFVPTNNAKDKASENDEEEQAKKEQPVSDKSREELIADLPDPVDFKDFVITPEEFEKDDDSNFHIAFITAASNLRAMNYHIAVADKHKTKGIAGNIIPALATTTSMIAGFVGIEFYKMVQGFDKIESYRNTFVNLALPYIGASEPMPAQITTFNGKDFTMWDGFEVEGDITLAEFLTLFKDKGMEIEFLSYDTFMIYHEIIIPAKKNALRMDMKIVDIIETTTKQKIVGDSILLTFNVVPEDDEDEDDDSDIDLPTVRYLIKN